MEEHMLSNEQSSILPRKRPRSVLSIAEALMAISCRPGTRRYAIRVSTCGHVIEYTINQDGVLR
jgi:hypothetical protein